jgi:hypothetical protein
MGIDRLGDRTGVNKALREQRLSDIIGTIVFVLIMIPVVIAALNVLDIPAVSQPAANMLNQLLLPAGHLWRLPDSWQSPTLSPAWWVRWSPACWRGSASTACSHPRWAYSGDRSGHRRIPRSPTLIFPSPARPGCLDWRLPREAARVRCCSARAHRILSAGL